MYANLPCSSGRRLFSPLDERVPLAKAEVAGCIRQKLKPTWRPGLMPWTTCVWPKNSTVTGMPPFYRNRRCYRDFLAKPSQYPALGEEILAPLRRAEKNDPFKPFLKLQQAVVLRELGRRREARRPGRWPPWTSNLNTWRHSYSSMNWTDCRFRTLCCKVGWPRSSARRKNLPPNPVLICSTCTSCPKTTSRNDDQSTWASSLMKM